MQFWHCVFLCSVFVGLCYTRLWKTAAGMCLSLSKFAVLMDQNFCYKVIMAVAPAAFFVALHFGDHFIKKLITIKTVCSHVFSQIIRSLTINLISTFYIHIFTKYERIAIKINTKTYKELGKIQRDRGRNFITTSIHIINNVYMNIVYYHSIVI